jgi:thiamine-monophosphate kinase
MNPFTPIRSDSVVAQGELKLIAGIRRWLGSASPTSPFGIGDDCAVIPPTKNHQLVTTDPVIFGRHFDENIPAKAVGAKLLKRNLSDIAAMGGKPVAAVISLALAPETSVAWLREFYRGLAQCARRYRVKIVGGDLTEGPAGFIGAFLTLHGESAGKRLVTRTGAKGNDRIYVTGSLGGSRSGHHFNFIPRLIEGSWLARRGEVCAMMDLSDGLAKDLDSVTPPGLAPALDPGAIPISRAARQMSVATNTDPLYRALCDGEDYELLIVVRGRSNQAAFERAWRKRFPKLKLNHLGHFVAVGQLPGGSLRLADYHGYEHLS